MMTACSARDRLIIDLLTDPVCVAVMKRDGVKPREVLKLMRTVIPVTAKESGVHVRSTQ